MSPSNGNNGSRWSSALITVVLALLAFTVQWGVVTTKLDHVEKRLDELISETRALRMTYQDLEHRVSFLEGLSIGRPMP